MVPLSPRNTVDSPLSGTRLPINGESIYIYPTSTKSPGVLLVHGESTVLAAPIVSQK